MYSDLPVSFLDFIFHREFQGWFRNAQSFLAWSQDYLPSKVITLTDSNFVQTVLQSKDMWLIDFYANWCGPCQQFASEYEKVAEVCLLPSLIIIALYLSSCHTYL